MDMMLLGHFLRRLACEQQSLGFCIDSCLAVVRCCGRSPSGLVLFFLVNNWLDAMEYDCSKAGSCLKCWRRRFRLFAILSL